MTSGLGQQVAAHARDLYGQPTCAEALALLRHEQAAHRQALISLSRLATVIEQIRRIHSPAPGWERGWKYPAEALSVGYLVCAGCDRDGTAGRLMRDCPTLAALSALDTPDGAI